MIRIAVFLFSAVLLAPVASAQQSACWIEDSFASGETTYLLCKDGKLFVGNERGTDWRERRLPSEARLRAVWFLDWDRGFVVGDNGLLLATRDGGLEWDQVPLATDKPLETIFFRGESGWVAGWAGVMFHSSDGGRTWTEQTTGVSQGLVSVYFTDASHGWAVGWVGTILRTTDGGKTWEQVRSPAAKGSLYSVCFRDNDSGWAVGFLGLILRTRDGGLTWEAQDSPATNTLTSIVFDDADRGWITTTDGVLLSEDGGESWRQVAIGDYLFLDKVLRTDNSLWAVGPRGVLRETNGAASWQRIQSLVPATAPSS